MLLENNKSQEIDLHIFQIDQHTLGMIAILIAGLIWTTTFPLLKTLLTTISPPVLLAMRSSVAAISLTFCWKKINSEVLRDGMIMGVLLFFIYAVQLVGLETADANRSGFIYSLDNLFVPILAISLGHYVPRRIFVAAGMAITGIGIMCWENGTIVIGDWLVLLSTFVYAIYIIFVEGSSRRHCILKLTVIQLWVIAILSTIWSAPEIVAQMEGIKHNLGLIIYLGIAGIGIVTCLENLGQRWLSASETTLFYSVDPIFSAIFCYFILGEKFGIRSCIGAVLVVTALIFNQIISKNSQVSDNDKEAKITHSSPKILPDRPAEFLTISSYQVDRLEESLVIELEKTCKSSQHQRY